MSGPDIVTVLRTVDSALLTKTITRRQDGGYGIQAYDSGYLYAVARLPVGSIVDVGRLIANLELDLHTCIIRGAPLPSTNLNRTRRLLYDHVEDNGSVTPATFTAEPSRLLGIDVDSQPCPAWCPDALARRRAALLAQHHEPAAMLEDPAEAAVWRDDGGDLDPAPIDPARDHEICCRAVYNILPDEFHDITCYWQMTSGAGIKPGVRMRLWFWCDRLVSDAEAKRWLGGCEVDTSLYSPVQPHYVARPVFRPPSLDPVPQRSGFFWRHANMVPVPELPEPAPPPPPPPPQRTERPPITGDHREVARQCLERANLTAWEREFCTKVAALDAPTHKQAETLAKLADPITAKAAAYADACRKSVATAPPGDRHKRLRSVAITLFGMAEHGLLVEADVWADLLAEADSLRWPRRRADDLLTWCYAFAADQKPLPEGFR